MGGTMARKEAAAAGGQAGVASGEGDDLVDLSALATLIYGERYEIVELLGVGASGSVYRARDIELNEEVALKVLRKELVSDPATLERFRNEVRLARRVTHRNVARVFDIGEHEGERYLTMELVSGRSLSRRLSDAAASKGRGLPLSEIVELLTQICAGLQAAHESGVVHCDLKPDNILLSSDGRVVVTDFGIARGLMAAPSSDSSAAASSVRPEGRGEAGGRSERGRRSARVVQFDGTPMYISPEQVNGERVDARTDLYSLGAVLFELLTGEPPFGGSSTVAVLAARLLRPPPDPRERRPQIPAGVAQLVMRCLAVNPAERPSSASELSAALQAAVQRLSGEQTQILVLPPEGLRSLAEPSPDDGDLHVDVAADALTAAEPASSAPPPPKVVVLPLDNLGEPVDVDWVAGITRELTDSLAALPALSVQSPSRVARALSSGRDPQAVAQALGAAWVVSGSLRRRADQVRLTLRLLRVADGIQVHAGRREGAAREVLTLTEELSAELAQVLLPGERPAARPKAATAATLTVEDYLRARALYERGDMPSVRQAVALLAGGLSHAPDEPRLLLGYAQALSRLWFYGDGGAAQQAMAAAERLVAVQPGRAESHMSLASVYFQGSELRTAMQALDRALALRPDFADAHELKGRILIETGPVRTGMEHLAQARRLDPSLLRAVADQARVLALLGRPDRAHELLSDRSIIEKSFGIQWILRGRLCLWSRDRARATAYLQDPELRLETYARARLLLQAAAQHTRIAAEEVLAAGLASDKSSPRGRSFFFQMHAELFAFFGQREQAVRSVARSVDAGLTDLLWLERCPLLAPLADDPRMAALRGVVYSRAFAVREALTVSPSPSPARAASR